MMNPDLKAKWFEALHSGRHIQDRGSLKVNQRSSLKMSNGLRDKKWYEDHPQAYGPQPYTDSYRPLSSRELLFARNLATSSDRLAAINTNLSSRKDKVTNPESFSTMTNPSETQEPFVLASEVHAGDFLIADGGFIHKLVFSDGKEGLEGLYVYCNEGKHYLEGQLGGPYGGFDTSDHLVGFWKIR